MKLEFLILLLTLFFIINIYHDGKYVALIKSWKKYYQMAFYAFIGISLYIFIKKYPDHSLSLFKHAHRIVKYMPIDKQSADILTPFLDVSSHFTRNSGENNIIDTSQYQRLINSGKNNNIEKGIYQTKNITKRCVSETKKKFVAANQNWKCGHCGIQLPAWFEIDHTIRLENGGDNHINNLVALCRDCHGKKTATESMI